MTTEVLVLAINGNKTVKIIEEKYISNEEGEEGWRESNIITIKPPTWKEDGKTVEPGQHHKILIHSGTRYIIEETGSFLS